MNKLLNSSLIFFDDMQDSVPATITLNESSKSGTYNQRNKTEEQEVIAAYQARCDAMVNKDITSLNEMMSDDLILRHITGATQTKDEWLSCIESEKMRYYNIDIKSISANVDGDKASLEHTSTLDARIYGGRGSWTLSGTSYFEKPDGNWIWCNAPDGE